MLVSVLLVSEHFTKKQGKMYVFFFFFLGGGGFSSPPPAGGPPPLIIFFAIGLSYPIASNILASLGIKC
jgi:hypothetical protein